VHWLGTEMVRGYAGGGGYDKHSAACAAAVSRMKAPDDPARAPAVSWYLFQEAARKNDGYTWRQNLESAGFDVWQAV